MRKSRIVRSMLLPVLFTCGLAACAGPLSYSATEIKGRIVDADSGHPVEGAIVVAQWVLFNVGPGHGGHKGRLYIYETVTDKNGRYVIPAWGPRLRPRMTELANRDPEILIFKESYEPKTLYNDIARESSVRVSDWDGKVIRLARILSDTNLEKYASRLNSFYSGLVVDMRNDYEWKSYPRMTAAVYAEYQRLKAMGLRVYRPSIPYVDGFADQTH